MTFGREKRLLLGALALVAPIPLPFNDILSWPLLFAYQAVVLVFLRRAWKDPGRWLPPWAMNVLGLVYLPVLYLDLAAFWGRQMVRPVVHLAMFAVLVKLFALRHERDKWHVAIGVFFLFLASMATSVHPSVVLYLVVMVALELTLLARFASWSVLARFGVRDAGASRVPLRGFLGAVTVASVLVAAPLFALLPRVRAPYITPRGGGGVVQASGFSDVVSLDSIGSTRENRAVVMRLEFHPALSGSREPRIKGATYDRFRDLTWRRTHDADPLPRRGGSWVLAAGRPEQEVSVWLNPLRSATVPLPVEALELEMPVAWLARDAGGGVRLGSAPSEMLRYSVRLDDQPRLTGAAPDPEDPDEPTLDAAGASPRVAALAREIMGDGDAFDRATRLERYLSTELTYSLDSLGRTDLEPIDQFLFTTRRGHCELFASAMTLMLRTQGIPARLVTGFLGAERNAFEDYLVIRQSNAHAWVEAYLPDRGWRIFDPTPPAGRPGMAEQGIGLLAQQAWDFLTFRWDRYVLTYGFADQVSLFLRMREVWSSFWRRMHDESDDLAADAEESGATAAGAPTGASGGDPRSWWPPALAGLGLAGLAGLGIGWWRRRGPITATAAFARLRRRVERALGALPPATPPLAMERLLVSRFPDSEAPIRRLVGFYLRESFGGESLDEAARAELRHALTTVEDRLGRVG